MTTPNKHELRLQGDTLHEIVNRAFELFDAYFGDADWEATHFEASLTTMTLRNQGGTKIAEAPGIWDAQVEAEVKSMFIGRLRAVE